MEDIEQAIQGVLNNPDMMEKIMGMAQAFGGGTATESPPKQESASQNQSQMPNIDLSKMSQLSGLLGQTAIDSDQQNLLNALSPYMSSKRISKLRKAMQAARLAELANNMMGKSFGQAGDTGV